jgi:hypothetical protein
MHNLLPVMKSHSCDYCRKLVLTVPQWLFKELHLNTLDSNESIDQHISLGCSLAQIEIGSDHGCALMRLLRTQLQNEINFSSENLAALRLEATCAVTDAQWVLSLRIRTPSGVFTLRSAREFYLCARPSESNFSPL